MAENPKAYKELAEKGVMVGYPASIKGSTRRPDIGIPYHSTVKFFNPEADSLEAIHGVASKLMLHPPDPKQTAIEPGQFKDRFNNDVYVLKLHGPHADKIKEHHEKFSHMGYPKTFDYQPHISVDKGTWDKVVRSGAKTAHEAGITFGPAKLLQGHNTIHTYGPKIKKSEPSFDEIKDLFLLENDLTINHEKAVFLNENFLKNYLEDNKQLKDSILKKHEERLDAHFGHDIELFNIAWEKGLAKAYKVGK